MEELKYLSNNLKVIADYELQKGNKVTRIDRPAGTKCPLAVVFKKPFDFKGHEELYEQLRGIEKWENRDRHYDLEAGYMCEKTKHVLSAPIK